MASESIMMDARKFLRTINSSHQSKVVFFEGLIKKLGDNRKKSYKLTSLNESSLIFEDTGANAYFAADISRKDRKRVQVSNIRPIRIVENEKPKSFDGHCATLVDCITEDDFKGADKAFRIIESQRFRPSVIPNSGWVTTKDGTARRVCMESDNKLDVDAISEAVARAVGDFLDIDESTNTLRGVLPGTGEELIVPMSLMAERKRVAGHMKSVAESAWQSEQFCTLIENITGMVSNSSIKEAITLAVKFLSENQEFSMLNSSEIHTLVENALATKGEFNSILAENVSALFHRTNARVNQTEICEAWEKTAVLAENAELLHRSKVLKGSENFVEDYDSFLGMLFTEDDKTLRADISRLRLMQNELRHSDTEENTDIIDQIQDLIMRAEETPDDIVKNDIRELLAANDEKIRAFTTLSSQDEITDDGISAADDVEGPVGPPQDVPEGGGGLGLGGLDDLGGEPPAEEPPLEAPPGEELDLNLESAAKPADVLVEDMTIADLKFELDSWKTDGHIYLSEDGFDNCHNQFARYIKRCDQLNANGLREDFESLRNVMISTGNDVIDDFVLPEDPYSSIDTGDATKINEEYGAKMDSPTGSGVAAKSGSEPGAAGKGAVAAGDPKMDSPTGSGVPETKVGKQEVSSGGGSSEAKMDSPTGNGLQKKGLGDAGLPHENESSPDGGKPKTGGAELDSPEGEKIAESAGDPEKVKPGTGKQYSGGTWIDKLTEKLTKDLPNTETELTSEKPGSGEGHPDGKGVAEGKDPQPNPVSVAGEKEKEKDKKDKDKKDAIDETQYKGAGTGFRGKGFKRSAISEEDDEDEAPVGDAAIDTEGISEDVAVMISNDASIDDVIDKVVQAMETLGDVEPDIEPDIEPVIDTEPDIGDVEPTIPPPPFESEDEGEDEGIEAEEEEEE